MSRWSVAALILAFAALAGYSAQALILPADVLARAGRVDEARAAFEEWLSQNAGSEDLFAVLLRRLALDPDPEAVARAMEAHGASLNAAERATIGMLPADFAELSGAVEEAVELLRAPVAGAVADPERLGLLEAELGLRSETPRPTDPTATLYLATDEHLLAGRLRVAQSSLATLVAAYPHSPERFLAEARVARFTSEGTPDGDTAASPSVVRPFAAPSVLIGLGLAQLSGTGAAAPAFDSDSDSRDSSVLETIEQTDPVYAIQTGSYGDAANAHHVVVQLTQAGFPARTVASDADAESGEGAGTRQAAVFRVLVGAHLMQTDAEHLLEDLRAAGYDGFLRADGERSTLANQRTVPEQ